MILHPEDRSLRCHDVVQNLRDFHGTSQHSRTVRCGDSGAHRCVKLVRMPSQLLTTQNLTQSSLRCCAMCGASGRLLALVGLLLAMQILQKEPLQHILPSANHSATDTAPHGNERPWSASYPYSLLVAMALSPVPAGPYQQHCASPAISVMGIGREMQRRSGNPES